MVVVTYSLRQVPAEALSEQNCSDHHSGPTANFALFRFLQVGILAELTIADCRLNRGVCYLCTLSLPLKLIREAHIYHKHFQV